jgi:hypothetical protein
MQEYRGFIQHQLEYQCNYCNRKYKRKLNYDKHILVCNILSKTPSEKIHQKEQDDLPTMREMYVIIQTLLEKQEKMEKQIEKMSSWVNNNRKKINVIEWLNINYILEMDFSEWILKLHITEDDMELVFNLGFIEGMKCIVNRFIDNGIRVGVEVGVSGNYDNSVIPIKAFEQKEDTLFIYSKCNNNSNWEIMQQNEFEKLFNTITKGLVEKLKIWQDKNKYRLFQNGFTEIYIENVKKITGGDLSREQQIHKIRHYIYNRLKINIKQLIQHEFVF